MPKLKRTSREIPAADGAEPFICECCGRMHVVLLDKDERPIATFGFDDEIWVEFLGEMSKLLKDKHGVN
jgi:hypothetical protein